MQSSSIFHKIVCFCNYWKQSTVFLYHIYLRSTNEMFIKTYTFLNLPYYLTVPGAKRDEEGYLWITGRIDDMVNVSGHLLSTAEVESALIEHEAVSEAASVSHPHHIKGECIYCFVTLKEAGFLFLLVLYYIPVN